MQKKQYGIHINTYTHVSHTYILYVPEIHKMTENNYQNCSKKLTIWKKKLKNLICFTSNLTFKYGHQWHILTYRQFLCYFVPKVYKEFCVIV